MVSDLSVEILAYVVGLSLVAVHRFRYRRIEAGRDLTATGPSPEASA